MKVREAMTREIKGIRADATLAEAAEQMRTLDVGSLPVVSPEERRVVGMLTDRDIVVRAVARGNDTSRQRVRDVMSQPLVCCRADEEMEDASKAMKSRRVRRLLVLNDNSQPVGMLSLGDVASSDIEDKELTSLFRYVSAPPQ